MYDTNNISIQMRKGILEYLILLIISKGEVYASDIITELQKYDLLIVEGTLYPLLSRLKKDQLLQYYWVESKSGPPRKYYKLTSSGKEVLKKMESTRDQLNAAILGVQNL
ncbi:MAG TPA: PadR family transcriptional regulator [Candidatus Absconditabacterales bacterium]|nr:PadR family transcriptional regulator [Candidatus Absconditabacterales bacterium]